MLSAISILTLLSYWRLTARSSADAMATPATRAASVRTAKLPISPRALRALSISSGVSPGCVEEDPSYLISATPPAITSTHTRIMNNQPKPGPFGVGDVVHDVRRDIPDMT